MGNVTATSNNNYSELWQASLPQVAWGTILLFLGIILGYGLVIPSALNGTISYPLAAVLCGILAFASFTVFHDAGHGNLFQLGSKLKPLESVIGWIAAVPLLVAPYRLFQKIHDRHHAFTNDPGRDPDYFGGNRNWLMLIMMAYWTPINYLVLTFTRYNRIKIFRDTYTSTIAFLTLMLGGLVFFALNGYALEVLSFAIVPNLIAVILLVAFFDFIPHYPHKAQGRFQNTRIYESKLLNILLLGQNYHLIHHMYPRLPWYKYQEVFLRIRPYLEANGAPIEHFGGTARPAFMQSPNAANLAQHGNHVDLLMTVSRKDRLTPDSVAITFAAPVPEKLKYKAGQYVTVSKWLDNEQQTRCYSLCRSPAKGDMTIGVKQVDHGRMSGFINRDLNVGDELIVQGPFGDFVYPPTHSEEIKDLVLVAGGSGITPILAILETALEEHEVENVHLIYACRDAKSIMFRERLDTLQAQYPNRFRLIYVLKDTSALPDAIRGRLDNDLLETLLAGLSTDSTAASVADAEFYICGPEGMKNAVVEGLKLLGAQDSRVHVEQFAAITSEPIGERYPVEIVLADGQQHTLRVASNQTVLDVACAEGVAIPHACGAGTCGTCKVRVDAGDVAEISDAVPGILADERKAGYSLACQCRPLSRVRLSVGGE